MNDDMSRVEGILLGDSTVTPLSRVEVLLMNLLGNIIGEQEVRSIVSEAIAEVIDSSADAFDILNDLENWLETHEEAFTSITESIASSYDSTHVYSEGDYCTYNYKLYKCTYAMSQAEAWTDAHWAQVNVIESMRNSIRSGEILRNYLKNNEVDMLWVRGALSSSTGGTTATNASKRCRTPAWLLANQIVAADASARFTVYFYNGGDSSDNYLGKTDWMTICKVSEYAASNFPTADRFKLLGSNSDDSMIGDGESADVSSVTNYIHVCSSISKLLESIAPIFTRTTSYSVGDCVFYSDRLYKFTANHAAGAWTGNDAEAIEVADRLNKISDSVTPEFDSSASYTAGSYVLKNGVLYRFTADHSGAWTGTDAETVTVGGEVTDLKADLTYITSCEPIAMTSGKFIDLSGTSITMEQGVPKFSPNSTTYKCGFIECSYGDVFTVNGTGGAQPRLWGFVNAQGAILKVESPSTTRINYVVDAPENSAWFIVHTNDDSKSFKGLISEVQAKRINNLESSVDTIQSDLTSKATVGDVVKYSGLSKTGQIVSLDHLKKDTPIVIESNNEIIREGSGDASPTNIRNFVGRSSAVFNISGKNLFSGQIVNLAFSSGKIVSNTAYRAIYQRVIGGYYYTVSRTNIETNRFQVTATINQPVADEPIYLEYIAANDAQSITFYVPEGYNYIFVYLSNQSQTVTASNYQIELGEEPTAIEAPNSNTINISFGKTVYGGKLSYSGNETWTYKSNKAIVIFNGSESWTRQVQSGSKVQYALSTNLPFKTFSLSEWSGINAVSNIFEKSLTANSNTTAINTFWWNTTATGFRIITDQTFASVDEFKAFLSNNNLVVIADATNEETMTIVGDDAVAYSGTNIIYSDFNEITATGVADLMQEIADFGFTTTDYTVSTNQCLGNITVQASKIVYFNDGTPPINEWYLLRDIEQNFYMSKDLNSKKFLFKFEPEVGSVSDWSFGIDADNNVVCILQAAALSTQTNLDDTVRTVNPCCWLASENYEEMHEIDFGTGFKPVGWLGNYGWLVLPNKDILLCEYTRPCVGTCNVWKIDGDITNSANWSRVWNHNIVRLEDSDTGMKHCHSVQYDFYTGTCYFGTGDSDVGSYVYYSTDNGDTWNLAYGPNKKRCRMLTFVFMADKVYWASDSYEANEHSFFVATRNQNDVIDIENATEIVLGAINKQACYGCVYLQNIDLIVMMDRNDYTVPDGWLFRLMGYDLKTNEIVDIGIIKPLAEPGGFRCTFVDWYPFDNHILTGFNPVTSKTAYDTNQNAVCGNLGGTTGDGSTRINNLVMSIYRKSDDTFYIRFNTLSI